MTKVRREPALLSLLLVLLLERESSTRRRSGHPDTFSSSINMQHIGEFIHFLSIANGSLSELDTQRIIANELGFLTDEANIEMEESIASTSKEM